MTTETQTPNTILPAVAPKEPASFSLSTEYDRLVLDPDYSSMWYTAEVSATSDLLTIRASEHNSEPTADTIVRVDPELIDAPTPERWLGEAEDLFQKMYRPDGTLTRLGVFYHQLGYRAEHLKNGPLPTYEMTTPRTNILEETLARINQQHGETIATPDVIDLEASSFGLRSFVEAARDHRRPRATEIEMEAHDRLPFHSFSGALLFAEGTPTGERLATIATAALATDNKEVIDDIGLALDASTAVITNELFDELEREDDDDEMGNGLPYLLGRLLNPGNGLNEPLSSAELIEAAEDLLRRAEIVVDSVHDTQSRLGKGALSLTAASHA